MDKEYGEIKFLNNCEEAKHKDSFKWRSSMRLVLRERTCWLLKQKSELEPYLVHVINQLGLGLFAISKYWYGTCIGPMSMNVEAR